MKLGDLVEYKSLTSYSMTGIIVGFNEKGEGGEHFVHVLKDTGEIEIHMAHMLEVVKDVRTI